jgi:hypothetical protein
MLRKVFWIFFLLLAAGKPARAQDMDVFTHQLLFNIFTGHADTAISGFLKLYVPVLYEQKRNASDWTRYPAADSVHTHEEMHAFIFTRHPYFREKFAEGRLDITCRRYGHNQLFQNITGVQLWFEFDLLQDAEIAFSRLVDMFILGSTDKKFSSVNGAQKAAFVNNREKTGFNRVQLKLMADNGGPHKFRILFETGNEL